MRARLSSAPWAFWLASIGVAWVIAFTVWVLVAPLYAPGGESILEANEEPAVRFAVAAPLLVSMCCWLALHRACQRDSRIARTVAGLLSWLLLAFSVVTGFTIGMFVLPAAIALVAAVSVVRRRG